MDRHKAWFLLSFVATLLAALRFVDLSGVTGVRKIPIRTLTFALIAFPMLVQALWASRSRVRAMLAVSRPWVVSTVATTAVLAAVSFSVRWGMLPRGAAMFTWGKSLHYGAKGLPLYVVFYSTHCFLQELVARGLIIEGFLEHFPRLDARIVVVSSSLLFGVAHYYMGAFAVAMTLVTGVVLGSVYLRHRNVWGVTVIHYLVGLVAISFGWA